MEEDDEIESHPSRGSGSMDRRITVTVASAAPPPPQNTLTLALPIQQPRATGGGGGREDCWSEDATAVLVEAWGERYLELSRGNLKQKHWKEVADIVNSREDYAKAPKTDVQCKNRIDTVKKKYKVEKAKIASGGGRSNWRFFDRMDQLIGPSASAKSGSSSLTPFSRDVPTGIPVGARSAPVQSLRLKQQQQQQQQLRIQQHRKPPQPPPADSDSSESEPVPSPDSPDSDLYERKRPRVSYNARQLQEDRGRGGREKNWGDSVRELTKAIMKFGEVYEQTESSKLRQMVEMEKERMKFAKELELERLQLFMKTQMEMSQLKHIRGGVANNNNNHLHNHNHNHHSSNNNTVHNNHSDDGNN